MCWEYVDPSTPRVRRKGNARLRDDLEHRCRRGVLEARPAQPVIRPALRIQARREDGTLNRLLGERRPLLGVDLQVVQALDEQQVGDLLDDLERVGDATGPEGVPDAVDLALEVTGDHGVEATGVSSVQRAFPPRMPSRILLV